MGAIFSKERKKSQYERLERLEIESNDTKHNIEQLKSHKKSCYTFSIKTFFSFIICIGLYGIFYNPEQNNILHCVLIFLIISFVGFIIYKCYQEYFSVKIEVKSKELQNLQIEKKMTLEQVRNEQPYNAAKDILTRFEEDRNTIKITYL